MFFDCLSTLKRPCAGMYPIVVVFAAVVLLVLSTASAQTTTFVVEQGVRQLFLDDVGIDQMTHVQRVLHEPQRHRSNPVLAPDKPWEARCQVYGTAYYDEQAKLFKLWYLTILPNRDVNNPVLSKGHTRLPHTTLAAYAYSQDGINWVKPNLNQFSLDGDSANNLLDLGVHNCEGMGVLYDPGDSDPNRRWKVAYWDHAGELCKNPACIAAGKNGDGWCVASSPDGIHWTPYEGNPVLVKYCDTTQNLLYDPRIKKYVGFSRFGLGRRLARSESDDFLHWSEPQVVLQCDELDGEGVQIYGAGVDLYEGIYIAMIWIYPQNDSGRLDTQLAASRDGIHWTRVADRQPWLRLGPDPGWEAGMARSVARIIQRGNELFIYYCGCPQPHSHSPGEQEWAQRTAKNPDLKKLQTAVGLLTLRRDGFVSLRANCDAGTILTQPFILPEGTLHVNCSGGAFRATLCDAGGEPISGFEQSQDIWGNQLDAEVLWEQDIPQTLRGQPVRLKFYLKNADMYSYWWQ